MALHSHALRVSLPVGTLRRVGPFAGLLMALAAQDVLASSVSIEGPPAVLQIRVYPSGHVDAATLRRAISMAHELLSPAGLGLVWRVCEGQAACPVGENRAPGIVVSFSPGVDARRPSRCGMAAFGGRESEGTVQHAPIGGHAPQPDTGVGR
jgi:hypothetical protein